MIGPFPVILFGYLTALFLATGIAMVRGEIVGRYRSELIDRIAKRSGEDAERGLDYLWRWRRFDAITYYDMLRRFWKPCRSFWGDDPPDRPLASPIDGIFTTSVAPPPDVVARN